MADELIGNGLELTKGDAAIKVRGREVVVAILIVVVVLGGGWMVMKEVQAHDRQAMDKLQLMQENHTMLIQGHKDLQESIEASLYLLSLPDAERAKLRLRKPIKIRQMEGRE